MVSDPAQMILTILLWLLMAVTIGSVVSAGVREMWREYQQERKALFDHIKRSGTKY
jgi:hypothetical protein